MSISRAAIPARGAGRSGAPPDLLQRVGQGRAELAVDHVAAAEARQVDDWEARLAADRELVALLAWESYSGPQSDLLYEALAEYGWAVMRAWIATGGVFGKCWSHGLRGVDANPLMVTNEADVEDLARDVVSEAIVAFRDDILRRGRWSPDGGASLKTFFIGQCLIRFVPLHRTWSRRVREEAHVVADALQGARAAGIGQTDEVVALRDEVERAASSLADPVLRGIVVLNDAGFSHREVARRVGLGSAKAVERRLHKHRQKGEGDQDAQP